MYTFETLPLCDQWDDPIPDRFLRRVGAAVAFLHPALYDGVIACMRVEADILWVGYVARPRFLSFLGAPSEPGVRSARERGFRIRLRPRCLPWP